MNLARLSLLILGLASSRPHLALLLLSREYSIGGRSWPQLAAASSGKLSVTATWVLLRPSLTPTDSDLYVSSAYIISLCPLLSINHTNASAYLPKCVLLREISDWRVGQGSIWNINKQPKSKLDKKALFGLGSLKSGTVPMILAFSQLLLISSSYFCLPSCPFHGTTIIA